MVSSLHSFARKNGVAPRKTAVKGCSHHRQGRATFTIQQVRIGFEKCRLRFDFVAVSQDARSESTRLGKQEKKRRFQELSPLFLFLTFPDFYGSILDPLANRKDLNPCDTKSEIRTTGTAGSSDLLGSLAQYTGYFEIILKQCRRCNKRCMRRSFRSNSFPW